MTDTPEQLSRLDRIEQLLLMTTTALGETVRQQQTNTNAIAGLTQEVRQVAVKVDNLTDNVNNLTDTATSVLGRSAILDDVILGLHETTETLIRGFEQHQQNFENNQRSIEAALNRLESMILQIIRRFE